MSSEVRAGEERAAGEEQVRAWKPSLRPDRPAHKSHAGSPPQIIKPPERRGWLSSLLSFFKLPLVKAFIAISLFIVAAILFDATINGGSWTEMAPKQKATQQKRAKPPRA